VGELPAAMMMLVLTGDDDMRGSKEGVVLVLWARHILKRK
jgi:hypothetical protein